MVSLRIAIFTVMVAVYPVQGYLSVYCCLPEDANVHDNPATDACGAAGGLNPSTYCGGAYYATQEQTNTFSDCCKSHGTLYTLCP